MQDDKSADVYAFKLSEGFHELARTMTFKATPDTIQALGGELLQGTKERVPASELDAQGRYKRVNTGWGDLR
jgi:hypothetical protein